MDKIFFKTAKEAGDVILYYIENVKYIPDLSCELVILFDKKTWFSFFWNSNSKEWRVFKNTENKWIRPIFYTSEKLIEYLKDNEYYLSNVYGILYKTSKIKKIYLKEN